MHFSLREDSHIDFCATIVNLTCVCVCVCVCVCACVRACVRACVWEGGGGYGPGVCKNIENYPQENLVKERKNQMANSYTYCQLVQKSTCEFSLNANLLLERWSLQHQHGAAFSCQEYPQGNTAPTVVTWKRSFEKSKLPLLKNRSASLFHFPANDLDIEINWYNRFWAAFHRKYAHNVWIRGEVVSFETSDWRLCRRNRYVSLPLIVSV